MSVIAVIMVGALKYVSTVMAALLVPVKMVSCRAMVALLVKVGYYYSVLNRY